MDCLLHLFLHSFARCFVHSLKIFPCSLIDLGVAPARLSEHRAIWLRREAQLLVLGGRRGTTDSVGVTPRDTLSFDLSAGRWTLNGAAPPLPVEMLSRFACAMVD